MNAYYIITINLKEINAEKICTSFLKLMTWKLKYNLPSSNFAKIKSHGTIG